MPTTLLFQTSVRFGVLTMPIESWKRASKQAGEHTNKQKASVPLLGSHKPPSSRTGGAGTNEPKKDGTKERLVADARIEDGAKERRNAKKAVAGLKLMGASSKQHRSVPNMIRLHLDAHVFVRVCAVAVL